MLKKISLFTLAIALYTTGMFAAQDNPVTIHNGGQSITYNGMTFVPAGPVGPVGTPNINVTLHNDAHLVQGSAPKRFVDGFTMGPGLATMLAGSAYAAETFATIAFKQSCYMPHTAKALFAATTLGGAAAAVLNFLKWMGGAQNTNTAMWLGWVMATGLCTTGMFVLSPSINGNLVFTIK